MLSTFPENVSTEIFLSPAAPLTLLFWEARCWVIKKPLFDFNRNPSSPLLPHHVGHGRPAGTTERNCTYWYPLQGAERERSFDKVRRRFACSFSSTTAHIRPRGSHSLHAGQLRITGRMFVNQCADLRRETPACFPVALTFSFSSATPIFHQMHHPLLPLVLPYCHPPSAQRPRSQNQSTTPFPPRPRRSQSSMYPSTTHV